MAKPGILVFGRSGQIGRELLRAAPPDLAVTGVDRVEADLTDPTAIAAAMAAHRPAIVINAAAYTDVDKAESESALAFAVNRDGAGNLASACAAWKAALIHISTDYVFDGEKPGAYVEEDAVAPLNVYGRSKAAGEAAVRERLPRHVIVRTEWIYGAFGRNFLKTMLRLATERTEISVVDDQRGAPTSARAAAHALLAVARNLAERPTHGIGTFHFAAAGETTWHGFAQEIFRRTAMLGLRSPRLKAIATAAYPTAARRPRNSVFNCERIESLHGVARNSWQEELRAVMDELLAPAERPS